MSVPSRERLLGRHDESLTLSRRLVFRAMAALALIHVVLAAINLSPLIDRYTIARLFDVNQENTVVVWLSSGALFAIAVVALVSAAVEPRTGVRRGWIVIAAIFGVLSLDETASLHEMAGELGSRLLEVPWLPSLYMWVIVVTPFAAIGAVWMIRWFGKTLGWRTPAGRMAILGIALWMTVPLFEAVDPTLGGPRLLIVVEESIEASGEILLLWAVLRHVGDLGLTITRRPRS